MALVMVRLTLLLIICVCRVCGMVRMVVRHRLYVVRERISEGLFCVNVYVRRDIWTCLVLWHLICRYIGSLVISLLRWLLELQVR